MTTLSTDIVDEDAADLQFPKDLINVESLDHHEEQTTDSCIICLKPFKENPKVLCAECESTSLCLQCFSLGLETLTHRPYHSYRIDRRHVPSHPGTDWAPAQDMQLLNYLQEFGYGNDLHIGRRLPNRTIEEVKKRMDQLCGYDVSPLNSHFEVIPRAVIRYNIATTVEEPPRYPPSSSMARQLAGYCAPRGDFDVEFEDNAEAMVAEIGDVDIDDSLSVALSCAIVDIYNKKVAERIRRKRIIRDHALLLRKQAFIMNRFDARMVVFMQLMNGSQFDSLMLGLTSEDTLRRKLGKLNHYRKFGIRRLSAISLFDRLNVSRNEAARQLSSIKFSQPIAAPGPRRSPPPLDISQFPCYSALTEPESELCAKIRVLPEAYLKFKNLLITESQARGGIRLMTARQLIKIDVNKTRKIFNFLRDHEFIIELKKE